MQVFASSLSSRAKALKKQRRKQNKLMYDMLPGIIVDKIRVRTILVSRFKKSE